MTATPAPIQSPATTRLISWVDYAKAIAIFLVVLLHTHCDYELTKIINAFVMPLFFIVSGYLFSFDRNPRYGAFAAKRFRQLVVPYLWINLVAYVAWVVVLRHVGDDSGDALAWHEPLWAIAAGIGPMLVHDVPLWSLLSFFVVEMLFYPLRRAGISEWIVAAGGFAASWTLAALWPDAAGQLPFVLGPSLAGLAFYACGFGARRLVPGRAAGLRPGARTLLRAAALVAAVGVFAAAESRSGEVVFYICEYGGSYPLFVVGSVAGAVAVIAFSHLLADAFGDCRAVRFVSVGTLLICGFHLLAFAAIKGVMLYGFHVGPAELTAGPLRGLAFATAAFGLTLPVVWAVRRWARWLVDK